MRTRTTVLALLLAASVGHAQQPVETPGQTSPATQPPAAPPATGAPATDTTATPPPATQQPAAPGAVTVPPPVPAPVVPPTALPARQFLAPSGLIFNAVRPDRVVDFEMVMKYLEDALKSSTDPGVRAQARGWRVLKATEPGPNGTVLYVFVIDPAVTGADYSLGRILSDAYPEQIQEIWKLYTGALVNQSLLNLSPLPPQPAVPLPPATTSAPPVAPPARTPPPPSPGTAAPPGTAMPPGTAAPPATASPPASAAPPPQAPATPR